MGQLMNQALLNKVAKRIKDLRKQKHVTQEVFYNDTNIHLARIETGRYNISISTLNAICEYFGISLTEFFQGMQ
jgi:transcriptional regulator with XRE-family HTH domain